MAILSPTIRRSLYRVLAQQSPSPSSNKASSNALFVGRRGGFGSLARRSIHSTCVLSVDALDMADTFSRRHGKHIFYTMLLCTNHRRINSQHILKIISAVGPNDEDAKLMLRSIGFNSLDELIKSTIPSNIMSPRPLNLQPPMTESEALSAIKGKMLGFFFMHCYYSRRPNKPY